MAYDVHEWLPDRHVGDNSIFRFVITDDERGGPYDFTIDRNDDPDQHTGTFSLLEWDETAAVIDAGAVDTLMDDGEVVYQPLLAAMQSVTQAPYKVVLVIRNEGGTLEKIYVFGQRFRGVPAVAP